MYLAVLVLVKSIVLFILKADALPFLQFKVLSQLISIVEKKIS